MKTVNSGSSETIEVEALLATSVLDADNVPNKNQSETCFSCGSEMLGLYCKDCGQKNDNLRRSIFSLIIEAFTSLFSLESRMWRTWLYLIIRPGRPAREFADGKRTLWTSPVRIYLAMSILLFGYMSLTETRLVSVRSDITPRDGFVENTEDLSDNQVRLKPQFLFFARQDQIDLLNSDVNFSRVEKLIEGIPRARFYVPEGSDISLEGIIQENSTYDLAEDILGSEVSEELLEALEKNATITNEDGETITDEELRENAIQEFLGNRKNYLSDLNEIVNYNSDPHKLANDLYSSVIPFTREALIASLPKTLSEEKYQELSLKVDEVIQNLEAIGINSETISKLELELDERSAIYFNNMKINGRDVSQEDTRRGVMRILRNPAILNEAFATYLPRIMFFMMPFAMFLGILFVRGKKNALMYDHLVHAAYIHAFTYMYLLFLIILSQWTNVTGLWTAFLWGMAIYLPISAKNMFQRGWFKTIWMSYNLAFSYGLTIFIILIVLLAGQLNKAVTAI